MPKKLSTTHCHHLTSRVFAKGKIMSLPYADYYRNEVFCVVNVMSGHCNCYLDKNLKCSLVVTQSDCK